MTRIFIKVNLVRSAGSLVSLSDTMQLPFYEKMGFRPGNRVYLELDLTKEPPKSDKVTDFDLRRII